MNFSSDCIWVTFHLFNVISICKIVSVISLINALYLTMKCCYLLFIAYGINNMYIYGWVAARRAYPLLMQNAIEILQSCNKPRIYKLFVPVTWHTKSLMCNWVLDFFPITFKWKYIIINCTASQWPEWKIGLLNMASLCSLNFVQFIIITDFW